MQSEKNKVKLKTIDNNFNSNQIHTIVGILNEEKNQLFDIIRKVVEHLKLKKKEL